MSPMNDEAEKQSANPLELRQDIDRGLTGDKVDFPDPAAAPLGTDDEAAGTPITPEQLEMARRAERIHGKQSETGSAAPSGSAVTSGAGRIWIFVIIAAIAALILMVLVLP